MDLARLFRPASVAVVGASPREDTYAHTTLANLERIGYPGRVYGVNPRYGEVLGHPCFASIEELPEPADAVVIAIPAAGVPAVVEQAGAMGCGGAVVYAAGFAEFAGGEALQAELRANALRHDLPICGPNCDGLIGLQARCALWGDAMVLREPGEVALISQSGNVGVNALTALRGLRLHTVVSSGNEAVTSSAAYLEFLAGEPGVRSVALYLEADGDGAELCRALAVCAEREVGVAVLKAGVSELGTTAAAAHTGSVAGDQRVFRALIEEGGAIWADDVHDLLELAKVLATRRRPAGRGLAVVTCSGGDSALAADEAQQHDIELPEPGPATAARLREILPEAATIANPLDYTALVWGEAETLRDMVVAVGEDEGIDQVLVYYDQPPGISGHADQSWGDARRGIVMGAEACSVPTMVASTLPELLDDETAWGLIQKDVPCVAGLTTALACAAALQRRPGDPARLREIAAACSRGRAGDWLAEHEAKALMRDAGLPVVEGRVAADEDDAVRAAAELGGPLALKLSAASLRHKSEAGVLELGVEGEPQVRAAYRRLAEADGHEQAGVLVERMAPPGVELLLAATRDAVVPALVVGLGGIWTELLQDAAVVPLPASPERVERALRSLRGAPLLTGGRGSPALDLSAAAELAAQAGRLLLEQDLELLELNPVFVRERGAVAIDASARRSAAAPPAS